MEFIAKRGWRTNIKITIFDLDGNIKEVTEFHNLLTTVGLNMMRDVLNGDITDGKIKRLAWGDDATAPAIGQTQLISEQGRQAITSQTAGATGVLLSSVYLAPATAVGWIRELGWFAGVDADDTPNNGIMIGRVLYSRNKTNLEAIQVDRTDTIAEVT